MEKFAEKDIGYSKYFLFPSAVPIEKGKAYYRNTLLFAHFFNYGLTENFSIGGGFEMLSLIYGAPIWFIAPKAGFQLGEDIHLGGGVVIAGIADLGTASFAYGGATLGSNETNLTVGLGYAIFDREFSEAPLTTIAAHHRISNSIALMTENYILPPIDGDLFAIGIHGIRILSRKSAFDIGLITFPYGFVTVLPFASYTRQF